MKCVFQMNEFCSLCLNVDVKLYKLSTAQVTLIEYIYKLKEFHIPCEDQYHACSICLAHISKTSNFIKMILNAQKLIDDLLKTTDVITKPMLKSIDRHTNGLNSLSVVSFGIFDDDKKMYHIYHKTHKTNQSKDVPIKGNQRQLSEKSSHKCKTDNNNGDEKICIEISSTSDEEIKEPLINVSLENEMGNDPLKTENNITKNSETTNENDSLETDSKQSKHKNKKNVDNTNTTTKKPVPRKFIIVDPESNYYSETEGSSSSETKKKKQKCDADYQPDSTSHSDDSDFDAYDDMGKRIRIPKDVYRVYPRKCEHCNYRVLKKYDHHRHYQYEHPDLEYPYQLEKSCVCSYCGVRKSYNRIKEHEKTHIKGDHKCPECQKVFSCSLYLWKHQYNVHRNHFFVCDYCSKPFKTRTDLMRHIRIHTGDKPFKCHICGAGFAHSGNRIIHIRSSHQNIKYVPKKQKGKKIVRRHKKYNPTDTDVESSSEELVRKKRIKSKKQRNSKKLLQLATEMKPTSKKPPKERTKHHKNKLQTKNVASVESGNKKHNNKRKSNKVPDCSDDNNINTSNMDSQTKKAKRGYTGQPVRNCISNNFNKTDEESDDECLADKKKRHECESNKITLNEEEERKEVQETIE